MDSLQWMGAVRVQTADKNITSNQHNSSLSMNILWKATNIAFSRNQERNMLYDPFLSVHKILIWEDNSETTFSLQEVLLDYGHVF